MRARKINNKAAGYCFVIAPVGDIGSATRIRSDKVLKHIIAPAATFCGYEPLRADQISKPGIITSQVIQHLIDDPLVIADLTGANANVFYELAVRHAVRKPLVQIIDAAETIPFDLAASRTIKFDYTDLDSAEQAREEIKRQIKAVEENPGEVDTPLTQAIELQGLRQSDDPVQKSAADIMAMLQSLQTGFNELLRDVKKGGVSIGHPNFAVEDWSSYPLGEITTGTIASNIRLDPAKLYATGITSRKKGAEAGKEKKGK